MIHRNHPLHNGQLDTEKQEFTCSIGRLSGYQVRSWKVGEAVMALSYEKRRDNKTNRGS
jgi:hypothetical protein